MSGASNRTELSAGGRPNEKPMAFRKFRKLRVSVTLWGGATYLPATYESELGGAARTR